MASVANRNRDLRLALVLNGGVSLAVWIGGVTAEIDAARRAEPGLADDGRGTRGLYAKLLNALRQDVVVDVIGGASAGGINGVLLGAAIYNSAPLPNLREVWISLGDFRTLLRTATSNAPPSVMRGDDVVLPELRRQLKLIYAGDSTPPDQDLYLFVPATDLFGYPHTYGDSSGRTFVERDHRRVFTFTSVSSGHEPVEGQTMRPSVWLGDPAAPELLARAARSSSSFPIAFEAHRLSYAKEGDEASERFLVDGGILDNQPFNPVLDRIAVAPATRPLKRVVLYVVPYVTEVGAEARPAPTSAAALQTLSAALNLPRDLPKLHGLERVEREYARQRLAKTTRVALRKVQTPAELADAAEKLFPSYRQTRYSASKSVYEAWAAEDFEPGEGVLGQNPAWDASDVPRMSSGSDKAVPVPWIPEARGWSSESDAWEWGLSPAERAAAWILCTLGEARVPDEKAEAYDETRLAASDLIAEIRSAKSKLVAVFRELPAGPDAVGRAATAYRTPEIAGLLGGVQSGFARLDALLAALNQGLEAYDCAASVQDALDIEVVSNAFGVQEFAVPMPFEYLLASAGIENSLGHPADTPATKLAGMKLSHFGGFLKRSWRANDWLWGRLDGVEHLLRALLDTDRMIELGPQVLGELAQLAFALEDGAPESAAERAELEDVWRRELRKLGWTPAQGASGPEQYVAALEHAVSCPAGSPQSERFLTACRRVLAARLQLRVLSEDLERVAETARDDITAGSSRLASGASWANRVHGSPDARTRVALFKDMRVGEEVLGDESSSRMVLGVGSQGLAVTASMLAGDQGGLPTAARTMLGTVRKLTLAASFPVRLLAHQPWLGAAAFALLVALVVWAATSEGALLGVTLPALAILAVIVGLALLSVATSVFEESKASVPRALGFAVFLGVPAAFFVLTRGGDWLNLPDAGWDSLRTKVEEGSGARAVGFAAAGALIAAALALVRLFAGRLLGRQNRTLLGLYRAAVVAALGVLAAGFVVKRAEAHGSGDLKGWPSIANERQGAILVLLLLAVLLGAGLLAEVVVPFVSWLWRKRLRFTRGGTAA